MLCLLHFDSPLHLKPQPDSATWISRATYEEHFRFLPIVHPTSTTISTTWSGSRLSKAAIWPDGLNMRYSRLFYELAVYLARYMADLRFLGVNAIRSRCLFHIPRLSMLTRAMKPLTGQSKHTSKSNLRQFAARCVTHFRENCAI